MSLEDSMKELAASNLKLAASFDRYADVVEKYGLKIEQANTAPAAADEAAPSKPPKAEKPPKASKGGKAKAEPEKAADNDGFDEDEKPSKPKKELTHDEVKAILLKIKEISGSKEPAINIIAEYGYSGIPQIQAKDFEAIYNDAEEWIEENE